MQSQSDLHLVTDGKSIYLEDQQERIIDILKNAKQPMFLVCVSDQVRRLDESPAQAGKSRSGLGRDAPLGSQRLGSGPRAKQPFPRRSGYPAKLRYTGRARCQCRVGYGPYFLPLLSSLFARSWAVCSGPGVTGVSAASSGPEEDLKTNIKEFTKVYELVENNFADKVTSDKGIYKGAIPGMLRTLDPHSNFFDPKEFQSLRDDQSGHYYGVGMQVAPRNGKTIVVAPFGGSPAYKAGLRPGDVILAVNDKKTDNLSTTEVADLLKGPRGTHVQVTVGREGADKPLVFDIVRDEISRDSVEDAFWVHPGIMYMKITQFNENTSEEMEDNFKRLGEANVKGLILDLRENPGGLLNEGVAVAGHYLRKGEVVVSHRGRSVG